MVSKLLVLSFHNVPTNSIPHSFHFLPITFFLGRLSQTRVFTIQAIITVIIDPQIYLFVMEIKGPKSLQEVQRTKKQKPAWHNNYLIFLVVQVQPTAFRSFAKGNDNLFRLDHNLAFLRNYFLVQFWYGTPVVLAFNIMNLNIHRHWFKSSLHLLLVDILKEYINLKTARTQSKTIISIPRLGNPQIKTS